jgi:hypothetical protein
MFILDLATGKIVTKHALEVGKVGPGGRGRKHAPTRTRTCTCTCTGSWARPLGARGLTLAPPDATPRASLCSAKAFAHVTRH